LRHGEPTLRFRSQTAHGAVASLRPQDGLPSRLHRPFVRIRGRIATSGGLASRVCQGPALRGRGPYRPCGQRSCFQAILRPLNARLWAWSAPALPPPPPRLRAGWCECRPQLRGIVDDLVRNLRRVFELAKFSPPAELNPDCLVFDGHRWVTIRTFAARQSPPSTPPPSTIRQPIARPSSS